MSEAHAQLHIGDETVADGEVSGGIIRIGFPGRRTGGGAEGSAATDTFPALNGDGGEVQTSNLAAPLQHALPESLAHDPHRVRALHDAFFSTGSAGAPGPRSFLALPPQQQRQIACTASTSNALQFPAGAVGRGTTGRQGVAALNSSAIGMAATTAWRRPAAALAPGAPGECALPRPAGASGFVFGLNATYKQCCVLALPARMRTNYAAPSSPFPIGLGLYPQHLSLLSLLQLC